MKMKKKLLFRIFGAYFFSLSKIINFADFDEIKNIFYELYQGGLSDISRKDI